MPEDSSYRHFKLAGTFTGQLVEDTTLSRSRTTSQPAASHRRHRSVRIRSLKGIIRPSLLLLVLALADI